MSLEEDRYGFSSEVFPDDYPIFNLMLRNELWRVCQSIVINNEYEHFLKIKSVSQWALKPVLSLFIRLQEDLCPPWTLGSHLLLMKKHISVVLLSLEQMKNFLYQSVFGRSCRAERYSYFMPQLIQYYHEAVLLIDLQHRPRWPKTPSDGKAHTQPRSTCTGVFTPCASLWVCTDC